ncbi:hypothetical protein BH24ACT22_BH24ACT22_07500 [soil metagenome]
MRVLKTLDRNRRVMAVPYQKPGAAESLGLTTEQCRSAAWALTPDGEHHRGAGAVNAVLGEALGTLLPGLIYGLPIVKSLQDAAYDWVAKNRRRLPGDEPYCAQHPDECR